MIMGRETRRWSQSAVLSPVQMGPTALAAREEGPAQHERPVPVAALHRPAPLLQSLHMQSPRLKPHASDIPADKQASRAMLPGTCFVLHVESSKCLGLRANGFRLGCPSQRVEFGYESCRVGVGLILTMAVARWNSCPFWLCRALCSTLP